MQKTAVLLLTHFVNSAIIDMYCRMRAEASEHYDVFLILNVGRGPLQVPDGLEDYSNSIYLLNDEKVFSLPYPRKCKTEELDSLRISAGNADLFLISFFKDNPNYDFIWSVEYDVHFQGNWAFIFDHFVNSRADLLGTTLYPVGSAPLEVQHITPPLQNDRRVRPDSKDIVIGFYPILRLSARMLRELDESYRQGWSGHYELVLGTIAKRQGLEIEDIGGGGPYVKPHNKNAFYFNNIGRWDKSPGNFVFRPNIRRVLKKENTLWHPVKPGGIYFNHCPADEGNNLYGLLKKFIKPIIYRPSILLWFLIFWRPAKSNPSIPAE